MLPGLLQLWPGAGLAAPFELENLIFPVQGELLTWPVLGVSGDENGIIIQTSLPKPGSLRIEDETRTIKIAFKKERNPGGRLALPS